MSKDGSNQKTEKIIGTAVSTAVIAFVEKSSLTYKAAILSLVPVCALFAPKLIEAIWTFIAGCHEVLCDAFSTVRFKIRLWMQSSRNITAKKYLIDPAMKTEVEKSTDNFILDQLKNLNLNLYDDKKNIEDITRK